MYAISFVSYAWLRITYIVCLFVFDRIIVNIIHSTSDYLPKVLRFLNVAFDSSGDCLIAGDHQGNIYVFDLYGNR